MRALAPNGEVVDKRGTVDSRSIIAGVVCARYPVTRAPNPATQGEVPGE